MREKSAGSKNKLQGLQPLLRQGLTLCFSACHLHLFFFFFSFLDLHTDQTFNLKSPLAPLQSKCKNADGNIVFEALELQREISLQLIIKHDLYFPVSYSSASRTQTAFDIGRLVYVSTSNLHGLSCSISNAINLTAFEDCYILL